MTLPAQVARLKPRMRGVLHQWAFLAAIPLGIVLGLTADGARGRVSAAVFAGSVVAMFGASALYHRIDWSDSKRMWFRRLDHAAIYGLIAGSYTPIGLIVLRGDLRVVVLSIVWGGAAAAIGLKFAWPRAPKWVSAVVAVSLGWVAVGVYPQLISRAGIPAAVLIGLGGLCYTLGAITYAIRRPDPLPAIFGYHEIFHSLVVGAVALQYAAIAFFVLH
ncbi:MAG TPA: hemolysin III family protein [Gaiellaceae bacterium]|nr:hemolysin III family protein [Gaiellaceae bacterium]